MGLRLSVPVSRLLCQRPPALSCPPALRLNELIPSLRLPRPRLPARPLDFMGSQVQGRPETKLTFARLAARPPPVPRFANPVRLNAAAGWVFLNDPADIQHVCAANTRNYAERYLPVRGAGAPSLWEGGPPSFPSSLPPSLPPSFPPFLFLLAHLRPLAPPRRLVYRFQSWA